MVEDSAALEQELVELLDVVSAHWWDWEWVEEAVLAHWLEVELPLELE